jgi:DNA-binding XRE family transcriptional regulator
VLALASSGRTRQEIADELKVTPEWVRSILAENGLAVSFRILKCERCGTAVAKGHKAHQGAHCLCEGCVRKQPDLPFAERLRAFRLARNMSRAQLGTRSGLSPAVIGIYERGHGRPNPNTASKLANALEVSIRDLIGPSSNKSLPRPPVAK